MSDSQWPQEEIENRLRDLIEFCGGEPDNVEGNLIKQMMLTSLKIIRDGHDTGQLKLMTRALKEIRYAYRVFNEYPGHRRISIFGSARTPEDHPDYIAARNFAKLLADQGW
ncbi:MAG: LOG family protein, partial [Chlamydiia bacterium]|nr:LOG family protein [Chlamydiia bacterium]